MNELFDVEQFSDCEFMTAKEKMLVLKAWKRFLENLANDTGGMYVDKYGLRQPAPSKYFTKRLYEHLHMHCSFIAHYSRLGFYETYFIEPEDTAKFISQFDTETERRSIEISGSYWLNGDYGDLNEAMCKVLDKYKKLLYSKCLKQQRDLDVARAKTLLNKHGFSFNGKGGGK